MDVSGAITLSPAKEFIADICINEKVGVWKSVVLSQNTSIQSVFRKLKEAGVKTHGHFLTTDQNIPLKLADIAPWERMWLRKAKEGEYPEAPQSPSSEPPGKKRKKTTKVVTNPMKKASAAACRTSTATPLNAAERCVRGFGASPLPGLPQHTSEVTPTSVLAQAKTSGRSQLPTETAMVSGSQRGTDTTTLVQAEVMKKLDCIQNTQLNIIETIKHIQQQQEEIASVCKTNAKALKKHKKKTIDEYVVTIQMKIAKLFCRSLFRELSDEQYATAVTDSLGDQSRTSALFRKGITYARKLVSNYRTEEKRKLLGKSNYSNYLTFKNTEVSHKLMRSMGAEIDSVTEKLYRRNVALLRKFMVEEAEKAAENGMTYTYFKAYVNSKYPHGVQEADWDNILSEERAGALREGGEISSSEDSEESEESEESEKY